MHIWFIDHDGRKIEKIEERCSAIRHLTTSGVLGGAVNDPLPSQCRISGNSLVILHTQQMDWVNYLKENKNIYALFVSDETSGRVSSHRDDSLKNAYFSVKYKFDTLIDHPLFKELIEAAKKARDTADPGFQSAWKALKDDLVSLEPLVIANVMLSAGLGLDALPSALEEEAKQAYEAVREEGDPDWNSFIGQGAEDRNRWLEKVI